MRLSMLTCAAGPSPPPLSPPPSSISSCPLPGPARPSVFLVRELDAAESLLETNRRVLPLRVLPSWGRRRRRVSEDPDTGTVSQTLGWRR